MSKLEVDPYYSVRDHVHSQIERIKSRNDKYQDLIRTSDTSVNTEFKELRKGLAKELRAVDKDLKGLREAVDTIEKNRSKFVHIKDTELSSRKKFVDDAQNTINSLKNGLDSPEVRRKIEDDERRRKGAAFDETNNALANRITQENSRFIKDQRQQTQIAIDQQDQSLEQLGHAVDRLGQIGRDINTEVKEQTVLLDSLGNEVDDASNKMNTVQAALSKLLKTKDGCQIWTIVILAFILILLIALVIWT